jgi:hypothetical protein
MRKQKVQACSKHSSFSQSACVIIILMLRNTSLFVLGPVLLHMKDLILSGNIVFFAGASHFHWLRQTHFLTMESVHYESVIRFMVQGPELN